LGGCVEMHGGGDLGQRVGKGARKFRAVGFLGGDEHMGYFLLRHRSPGERLRWARVGCVGRSARRICQVGSASGGLEGFAQGGVGPE